MTKYLMKANLRLPSLKLSIPILIRKNFQMIETCPLMKTHPHLKNELVETEKAKRKIRQNMIVSHLYFANSAQNQVCVEMYD